MLELAHLRNKISNGKFGNDEAALLKDAENEIRISDSIFSEFAISSIERCKFFLKQKDYEKATLEIQLIHNFPFDAPENWDQEYFYKVEFISYIEQINDVARVVQVIEYLAKLNKKFTFFCKSKNVIH